MLKITYKNPLTEIYQKEYAIYMLLASEFKHTECESRILDTLKLYYADLVRTNENGNPSYEKQYLMEEECEKLVRKFIIGKINMPPLHLRKARVTIATNKDGTHSFTFRSGVYYFTYRFLQEEIPEIGQGSSKAVKASGKSGKSQEEKRYRIILKVIETQGPLADDLIEGQKSEYVQAKGA